MSYSKLVEYVRLSPNCNKPRNNKITDIAIHHKAANATVEATGALFADPTRQASSNYGISTDGRVACYVEEENRSWCTGSPELDHRAITIEVANCGGAPNWPVSDQALESLITLCYDVCRRHGFKLNYTGDKRGNLHMHKWYANTLCPGPYLGSKFSYIAQEVNRRLGVSPEKEPEVQEYKPSVEEWQNAAIADGFEFPLFGADNIWGAECEAVAIEAVVMQRDTYMYPNLTKLVQKVVGVEADGYCGPLTHEAIAAYQARHNLKPVDGAAGIITWKEILL